MKRFITFLAALFACAGMSVGITACDTNESKTGGWKPSFGQSSEKESSDDEDKSKDEDDEENDDEESNENGESNEGNENDDEHQHTLDESGYCADCDTQVTPTEGIVYEISEDDSYAIVVNYDDSSARVRIADTYKGLPVTSIGDEAFEDCDSLTNITIPDSVTNIGYRAFYECSNLKNITIPDSVMSIEDFAFEYSHNLTSITIPNSVTSIGALAFAGCDELTNIKIGDGVTSIGIGAFISTGYYNDESNWENSALYLDGWLLDVKMTVEGAYKVKKGTKGIAGGAFSGCNSLTSVTILDGVTSIGNQAFYNCNNLTSITIPDSVTSIGLGAFENCDKLKSITIPDSVTSIGRYAFYGCYNLTIYCEAKSQPDGWNWEWNWSNRPVEWGV